MAARDKYCYQLIKDGKVVHKGLAKDLCKKLGVNKDCLFNAFKKSYKVKGFSVDRKEITTEPEYALYRGDKFICIATSRQICEKIRINKKTFQTIGSPSYRKRAKDNSWIVVKVSDNE